MVKPITQLEDGDDDSSSSDCTLSDPSESDEDLTNPATALFSSTSSYFPYVFRGDSNFCEAWDKALQCRFPPSVSREGSPIEQLPVLSHLSVPFQIELCSM